jgi:hypothetical protein
MRTVIVCLFLYFVSLQPIFCQSDEAAREAFIKAQNEYLEELKLDFYQNKEYQIITRNYDKQVMRINVTDIPKGVKKKRIKKLKKAKNQKMKSLLNPRQYKLYVRRQKVIEKTISDDW